MKKLLITFVMVLSLGANAWAGDQNARLRSLASAYKGAEGFEVVNVGGIGMSLLKTAVRNAADSPEDREALKLFSGIRRLTVVDFSDAEPRERERFLNKAKKILSQGDLLMEARDDGETVRIYGTALEDGSLLEDIAILAEDALIFIRGTVRMDQVGELMKQAEK